MNISSLHNLIVDRNKSLYSVGFWASLLMIAVILIPDLNTIGTEAILCVTMMWLPGILNHKIKLSRQLRDVILCLFIYLIVIIIYKAIGISTAWWDIAAGYYGCFCCAVISIYSLKLLSRKQLSILKWAIYIVFMVGMIYVYQKGINALATMNVEEAISQESAAYGSAVMIFLGISLIGLLSEDTVKKKCLYGLGFIISLMVTVIIMQRGTNVIMSLFLILAILIFKYVKGIKIKRILILSAVVIGFFYISGLYSVLFEFIIESIPSERLATRVQAIYFFLQTGDALEAGSSMTSRSELMLRSINTFLDSIRAFLIGVGDHRQIGGPIGNHAELLDTFARYGIFLSLFLYAYFIKLIKWWYNIIPESSCLRYQVCSILGIYIARNIWGFAMTSALSILLFLYLPLVVSSLIKNKREKI